MPGIAASLPGASAVVPELGDRYSPTVPLMAETVPSTGARRVASSTFRWACRTRASPLATNARCWAMLNGRSELLESSVFCAVTTLWREFSIETWPLAASTSCLLPGRLQVVRLVSTCRSALITVGRPGRPAARRRSRTTG